MLGNSKKRQMWHETQKLYSQFCKGIPKKHIKTHILILEMTRICNLFSWYFIIYCKFFVKGMEYYLWFILFKFETPETLNWTCFMHDMTLCVILLLLQSTLFMIRADNNIYVIWYSKAMLCVTVSSQLFYHTQKNDNSL